MICSLMTVPLKTYKSYFLVGIQFTCLAFIVLTGPIIPAYWIFQGLEFLGLALGLWALQTMTIRNLTILPDVRSQATLITHGPYRYVRHPMYSALLLVTFALILDDFSRIRFVVWVILLGDLLMKLRYEESVLANHFEGYKMYQRQTARLLPYLF